MMSPEGAYGLILLFGLVFLFVMFITWPGSH